MKLRTKLILGFLIATLIPFSIGMVVVVHKVNQNIISNSEKMVNAQAEAVSERLKDFFDKWTSICNTLSRFDFIKEKDWQKLDPVFKSISKDNPEITDFFMTNVDGSYWYGPVIGNPYKNYMVTDDPTDPNSPLKSINTLTYQKELVINNTRHQEKTVVTEAYTSVAQGMRMFAIGSTIMDSGRVQGVIGVGIEANAISTLCQGILSDFERLFGSEAKLAVLSNDTHVLMNYAWSDKDSRYVDTAYNLKALQTKEEALPPLSVKVLADMIETNLNSLSFKNELGGQSYVIRKSVTGSPYTIYLSVTKRKMTEGSASTIALLSVIGFIIAGIITIVTVAMGRRIARSITKTSKALKNISEGSGDLTVKMNDVSQDEIGDMGRYFNKFIDSQREMISNIKQEAVQMESVSANLESKVSSINNDIHQISSNVNDLNLKAESQSASAIETSSTVEQITRNIQMLTEQIQTQSTAVTQSSTAIQQMLSNINSISSNLDKASTSFQGLENASREGKNGISAVQQLVNDVSAQSIHLLDTNKLINSIASQTNLLAMNAAIEAAHAGEAGQGFSVVANEIRKLAEDASRQSKAIAEELKNVVANIESIVGATAKADSAFDSVVQQVLDSGELIENINLALREQTEGNHQVLNSLKNIQEITVQVHHGSTEMNTGAKVILDEMSNLTQEAHKVLDNSKAISKAVETIGISIDDISKYSVQNSDSVKTLNAMTGKFKL